MNDRTSRKESHPFHQGMIKDMLITEKYSKKGAILDQAVEYQIIGAELYNRYNQSEYINLLSHSTNILTGVN